MIRRSVFPLIKLTLALAVIYLAGCSTTQVPQQEIDRQQHQLKLSQFSHWNVKGRLAFKSPDEKFSAYLNWEQQQDSYSLNLNSFIGTSLMKMQGYSGYAQLEADDYVYTDTNASHLVTRITGWNIPVEKMALWVKGQYEQQDKVIVDEYGLAKILLPKCKDCQQWQLTYSKYKLIDEIWLPHQIVIDNTLQTENQIKIRINSWQKK